MANLSQEISVSTSINPAPESLALPGAAASRRSTRSPSPAALPAPPPTAIRPTPSTRPFDEDFPASQMVERLPRAPVASDRSAAARMQRRVAAAAQKNGQRLSEMSSVAE